LLILLPPSEGKADRGTGRPLKLEGLSLPEHAPARAAVLEALVDLCVLDEPVARQALGLGAGQAGELRHNAALRSARTLPAAKLYTGVLYDALDLGSLASAQYSWLKRSIVIFSGLWGAVRLDDRIPPYRCSMDARLPGIGGLGAYWKRFLAEPLAGLAGNGVVLDLRSSSYAAAWVPSGPLGRRTVAVRILHERTVDGQPVRSVVSHFNKATKGRLVRDLAMADVRPRSVRQLVTALRDLKYTVEQPVGEQANRLDVVVTEV